MSLTSPPEQHFEATTNKPAIATPDFDVTGLLGQTLPKIEPTNFVPDAQFQGNEIVFASAINPNSAKSKDTSPNGWSRDEITTRQT